jgi:hypothetical protein
MSKRQEEDAAAAAAAGRSVGESSIADDPSLLRAACEAAKVGDQLLEQGRFRDASCFIPSSRADRHQQEGFAVHGASGDALSSAVLDLMHDDAVSCPQIRCLLCTVIEVGF